MGVATSSWSYVQEAGSRSGRHRPHWALCRKRPPVSWEKRTSATRSGRTGFQDMSLVAFQRDGAPEGPAPTKGHMAKCKGVGCGNRTP